MIIMRAQNLEVNAYNEKRLYTLSFQVLIKTSKVGIMRVR
jgi:hypothetical protein